MTYCVATRLNAGIVFLSDSRTNAGVDDIGTFRKMNVFSTPGERVIVTMSSGNLAITQAVCQKLGQAPEHNEPTIWSASTMFDVAAIIGCAIRQVYERDAKTLKEFGIDFNCNLIVGGQIQGESCRLFHIYSAGNFIEASNENLYFQIGEAKYGKPIIDRVVHPNTSLDESAKCLLISMDSTLRSNLSVGLPLDLLCYQADSLIVNKMIHIDDTNEYFKTIRQAWGNHLKQAFSELPNPQW